MPQMKNFCVAACKRSYVLFNSTEDVNFFEDAEAKKKLVTDVLNSLFLDSDIEKGDLRVKVYGKLQTSRFSPSIIDSCSFSLTSFLVLSR